MKLNQILKTLLIFNLTTIATVSLACPGGKPTHVLRCKAANGVEVYVSVKEDDIQKQIGFIDASQTKAGVYQEIIPTTEAKITLTAKTAAGIKYYNSATVEMGRSGNLNMEIFEPLTNLSEGGADGPGVIDNAAFELRNVLPEGKNPATCTYRRYMPRNPGCTGSN